VSVTRPSLRREKALLRDGSVLVAGCDEVGRGALAGPVTVGIVVIDSAIGRVPKGLADSKLLTPQRWLALVPLIKRWCRGHAVGHASPGEIDRWGLTIALRLAGHRALAQLGIQPDVVLLDGSYDWLSPRDEQTTMWEIDLREAGGDGPAWPECRVPQVVTQIKADLACASVAAASVLAKTNRDAIMIDLADEHPHFAWDENKGYASDRHREELRRSGPCDHHRRSWRLGLEEDHDDGDITPSTVELSSEVLPSH
jgi:ribonuclease HII